MIDCQDEKELHKFYSELFGMGNVSFWEKVQKITARIARGKP